VQQQHVTVKEVKDNDTFSYVEGTLQPLTEEPTFPGHYQIDFPGEQIEDEMNSNIEENEPLPIPLRDHRLLVLRCPLFLLVNLPHHLHLHNMYNHSQKQPFEAGCLTNRNERSS